jgi:hypothetical protein
MTNKQYFENAITELSKRVSKIEETLAEFIWKSENPPKYKYGDTGYMPLLGKEHPVKILKCELKHNWRFGCHSGYYWEYTVDVTGIGMSTYSEDQIQL